MLWWRVGAHVVWVTGLALALAAISYRWGVGRAGWSKSGNVLCWGLLLAGLGLAVTSASWLEGIAWTLATAAFAWRIWARR